MARTLVFVGSLIAHWVTQFVAWSYADRSTLARIAWNILASPLIHMAASLASKHFWVVASLNSVVWAAALTYVVGRYTMRG